MLGKLAGTFARKRVLAGIEEKMDGALPSGSAAVIAVYDHGNANSVANALANAIRTSTVQIDKASAKELKAGLEKHRPASQDERASADYTEPQCWFDNEGHLVKRLTTGSTGPQPAAGLGSFAYRRQAR